MILDREKGPVEILCKEIDFPFERRMETVPIFVAFVARLVGEAAGEREMEAAIAHVTGKTPSAESAEALRLAVDMLTAVEVPDMIARAARLHDYDSAHNPDEGPCDHLIDMLNSCASAIRFGLEKPCHSRHAASAAQHIWRWLYGIRREDSITPHWSKHWSRVQLQLAITDLALRPPQHSPGAGTGQSGDDGAKSATQD